MVRKKVCWNITARCNQKCKYCHRFLNVKELDYTENETILRNLIRDGITEITWTGGEALLYPNLLNLLKIAKQNGIKSKLITNGIILAKSNEIKEICDNLDYLTLSLDSINDETNNILGRGENHYKTIKKILDYANNKNLKLNINTVVNKQNLNQLEELGEFLNNYKIDTWKFFKFMPLRETAEKNKELFEITEEEFESKRNIFERFENINKINYKQEKELEESILILANGDIVKTENGVDIKKGNALYNNIVNVIDNNVEDEVDKTKIRTLVAHSDDKDRELIVNAIKNFNYVDIVAITNDGIDTYNKIVSLKPEIVFSKYDFDNLKGIDLLKKSKEILHENIPVFNFISETMTKEEIERAYDVIGDHFNIWIENTDCDRIADVMQEYREYMYN